MEKIKLQSKNKQNKRGFLGISFSLIFAFLVGGLIIFGAIYGLSQFTKGEELVRSATSGEELLNIITSFESSSEESRFGKVEFPAQSQIISRCENTRGFGSHTFRIAEEIRNRISENDIKVGAQDKYIFSEESLEGKEFNIFAKTFSFPYEVATISYITSSEDLYCFSDAPRAVEKELRNNNQENIIIGNCDAEQEAITVCFTSSLCDIEVNYNNGVVRKDGAELFFAGDELMYAAIFANQHNYECGLQRLMSRAQLLSEIYQEKSVLLKDRCDADLVADIGGFSSALESFSGSQSIASIANVKQDLETKNDARSCKLW